VAAAEPPPAPPSKESGDEEKAPPQHEEEDTEATPAKPHKASSTMVAVTFRSEPEGARVSTKNHVYGTTPQPAKLAPGSTYDLTFTKVGYATTSKKYVVPSKGPQTLRVSLKKLPEPPKPAPAPSPAAPTRKKGWFWR
jgi:hypothetical protein